MTGDAPSGPHLPSPAVTRIHALWDPLADFGAHATDAAVAHAMRMLSELVGAERAFWLGAVRLGADLDSLGGWRIRAIQRLDPRREDDEVYRFSRQRLDHGTTDEVTRAQVREAGAFRARLLRELAPPGFFATRDYTVLYRARNISDAIFVAFPVNEDAESYFGWYRIGEESSRFSPVDRELLAYALRALTVASCCITACSSRRRH